MRRKLAALTLGVLAAYAFAGCTRTNTANENGARHSWTQPNLVRIALYLSPNSLNPILASNTGEVMLTTLVFDPLVTVDDKGNDVPVLAATVPTLTNGGISSDGRTITYKLRRNVKWHDGVAFTSDDVKFSWQAVMNPANNVVSRRGYDLVNSVDTPDKYTVVFHMKAAFAPAIETLFSESDAPMEVLPKHLLAKYANINQIPFNAEPVGTGPFKFGKWIRGDRIEFIANPDYFLGKPRVNSIVFKIVPDTNTQDTEMKDHEVDVVPELGGPQYRDLKGLPDVVTMLSPSPQYEAIGLNLSRPPLDDIRVRQALAYAIDTKKLTETTQFGAATVATEDISTHSWAYDPNVTRYAHDPAKAAALLDEAGWKIGPGGVRAKNGRPLSLQFVYAQGSTAAQAIGVQVQAQLKSVGIDTQIKTYNYTQLYASMEQGGIYNSGKFDLNIYAWVFGEDPDDSSSFMCEYIPPKGNNIMRFCNAAFDAAERDALSHFDRATRKAAYARTQSIMSQQIPEVFIFYRSLESALSPDLKNYSPNGVTETWNAYQWSI